MDELRIANNDVAYSWAQFQEYNGVISEIPSRKIILTFSYAQSEAS